MPVYQLKPDPDRNCIGCVADNDRVMCDRLKGCCGDSILVPVPGARRATHADFISRIGKHLREKREIQKTIRFLTGTGVFIYEI